MTASLRTVAHGLRTVATGIHLTLFPALPAVLMSWCAGGKEPTLLALGVSLIGVVITAVGRCYCLRTPPEMPVARARIHLAVILDLTGLGSTAALVVAGFVAPALPRVVVWSGVGFSAVALVAGRVMFLLFLHALAVTIRQPQQRASVRTAAIWSALAGGCVGVSYAAVRLIVEYHFGEVYFRFALVLSALSLPILGVIWWCVYPRTLIRLGEAVEVFANEARADTDDPDREYRARHPADAGEDPP